MSEPITFDKELSIGNRGGVAAWCEYALTRGALGTLSRIPRPLQRVLVRALGEVAMRVDKRHTNAARSFLAQALGPEAAEEDWRIVRAYMHLFQLSLDSDAFQRKVPQATLLDHYTITASDEVFEGFRNGTGGIIVTPHVGDWEAGAAIMPHLGMDPAYAVAKPPRNRYLSHRVLEVRKQRRVNVMPRRGGMQQAAAIFERGGWIAMLLDQRPRVKYAMAPFFGRLAQSERSAAVLMKRLGVPIVFGACYLTDRPFHYDLRFPVRVEPEDLAQLSVNEIVARVNAELETLILAHPEQYFWIHDRYRDSPEQAPVSESAGSPAVADSSDAEVAPEAHESASTPKSGR